MFGDGAYNAGFKRVYISLLYKTFQHVTPNQPIHSEIKATGQEFFTKAE